MLLYIPNKLISTKKEIIQKHKHINDVHIDKEDSDLRTLINRLVCLNEKDIKREAFALENNEIDSIAAYIPVNYYNVDMSNLFAIFTYRAEKRFFEILYNAWQDHFRNNECNAFIYHWLNNNDEIFGSILDISLKEEYRKMLIRGDVIQGFGEYVKDNINKTDKQLKEILEPWKLSYGRSLLWEMKFLLYTYCPRKYYFMISKEELLSFVKQYYVKKDGSFKKFVVNFVTELKLVELEKYDDIGNYLLGAIGNPGTPEFFDFFGDTPEKIVTKYTDWINRLIIDDVFENDERSLFWREFRFKSVTKYDRSNSVVMDMGKYYVTEFLGRAMGPMYFYKKDIFDEKVKKWFVNRDNKQLRSALFNHEDYYFIRQEHKKPYGNEYYWQGQVADILQRYNMTRRISD